MTSVRLLRPTCRVPLVRSCSGCCTQQLYQPARDSAKPPYLLGFLVEATRRYSNYAISIEKLQITLGRAGHRPPTDQAETPWLAARRVYKVRQRLDSSTIVQLVTDYGDGIPTTQLVTKYRLAKGTVLRLLREAGVVMCV